LLFGAWKLHARMTCLYKRFTIKKANTMKIYTYPSKTAEGKVSAIINRGLSFREKVY